MDNPFEGKKVALGWSRFDWDEEADLVEKHVKRCGGHIEESIIADLDYIVCCPGKGMNTPEIKKANDLKAGGSALQILSYKQFQETVYNYTMGNWPKDKTKIDDELFIGFNELETITIPEQISQIGRKAFCNCSNVTRIVLPKGLKQINKDAFNGCNLQSIELCDGLEMIGSGAFRGSRLNSVTIPSTVTVLEYRVFSRVKTIKVFDSLRGAFDIGDIQASGLYNRDAFIYSIVVLSKDTGDIKYVVPMFENIDDHLTSFMRHAWSKNKVEFDFMGLDAYFGKIKWPECKTKVAECRLKYPIDLSAESRKIYESYLKRASKKTDSDKQNEFNFVIKGKKLIKYKGHDSVVVVPDGVTEIGHKAFSSYPRDENLRNIKSITIPEGVVKFETDIRGESDAFGSCNNLEILRLPDTLTNMPYSVAEGILLTNMIDSALDGATLNDKKQYNEYDGGLYLGNEKNPYVCLVKTKSKDIKNIVVHEGCRIICGYAFEDCLDLESIKLPDSIVCIEPENSKWVNKKNIYLRRSLKMNMPKGYLRQTDKFPSAFTYDLITAKWKDEVTIEDFAWLYIYQSSKTLQELSIKKMKSDPNRAAFEMDKALKQCPKKASYKKAAAFANKYNDLIDDAILKSLYDGAVAIKANDAIELLSFV